MHNRLFSLPTKRSFPDEFATFQQRDKIRTFQDLNESIAPAGFQFKELDNCVLYFRLVFDDETKFPKKYNLLKLMMIYMCSCKYSGMSLLLHQWFVQGHNATLKKVCY